VRALHDPVWTADGYVSERWRPVSPVSGRLDAFQWQMPLAALPSDKGAAIESSPFEEAMLAAATPRRVEPPREALEEAPATVLPPAATAAQDNSPVVSAINPPDKSVIEPEPAAAPPPPTETVPAAAPPLFRARQDLPKFAPSSIPPVIPIVRAPDDPGIDDEPVHDEFAEQRNPAPAQAGGWRGFLSRWGS
jgi:HemY protein